MVVDLEISVVEFLSLIVLDSCSLVVVITGVIVVVIVRSGVVDKSGLVVGSSVMVVIERGSEVVVGVDSCLAEGL